MATVPRHGTTTTGYDTKLAYLLVLVHILIFPASTFVLIILVAVCTVVVCHITMSVYSPGSRWQRPLHQGELCTKGTP